MVNYCCVPKCNGVGGFSFPEDKHLQKKWRVAVRRVDKKKNLWNTSEHSVVCEKHFEKSDFLETNICGHLRLRKKLRDGIVPTIFSFKTSSKEKKELILGKLLLKILMQRVLQQAYLKEIQMAKKLSTLLKLILQWKSNCQMKVSL